MAESLDPHRAESSDVDPPVQTAQPTRRRLAWLRPPVMSPDGRMTLVDHFKELRYRVILIVLLILVGMGAMAFFYQELYAFLLEPYMRAVASINASRPDQEVLVVNAGVSAPMTLAIKIVAIAGAVVTSPLWLYQVWAFLAPGLLAKEKKWAVAFIAAGVPLFLTGVGLGYWILPKGLVVLLGFTPQHSPVANMVEMVPFLNFMLQIMLVFGVAFLLPVVIVALNFAGVVTGKQLGAARSYAIVGTFVFAAVATPSTDPISMLALALPMALLYVVAEIICRGNDRRKAKRNADDELLDSSASGTPGD
ncbi:sec-independent protein translocase protein TatC [Raineyella antarctica]|uniref:Sec-independent protein translocase protein TatC n=1 Tax=Raineyella antarctica TaxID=1577474 RepID=A0A1G6GRU0_9ACTN|nr:twin-arginine translocase subunit TatC [Raineyella antarctica]SDB84661.1 sec-independent protein translocase protein TatC [Raineyella antarctica]